MFYTPLYFFILESDKYCWAVFMVLACVSLLSWFLLPLKNLMEYFLILPFIPVYLGAVLVFGY